MQWQTVLNFKKVFSNNPVMQNIPNFSAKQVACQGPNTDKDVLSSPDPSVSYKQGTLSCS